MQYFLQRLLAAWETVNVGDDEEGARAAGGGELSDPREGDRHKRDERVDGSYDTSRDH